MDQATRPLGAVCYGTTTCHIGNGPSICAVVEPGFGFQMAARQIRRIARREGLASYNAGITTSFFFCAASPLVYSLWYFVRPLAGIQSQTGEETRDLTAS
jgi:hypothetical protein